MTRPPAVALLVGLVLGALAAPASARDTLTATARLPLSPFVSVTWEWKYVGGAPAVAVTRHHADGYGVESDLELVSRGDYDALFDRLGPCLASDELVAADATALPELRVTWSRDGVEHERHFVGSAFESIGDVCLAAVRAAVLEHVVIDPYVVPYWDEGEYGTLRTTATRPAHVWIDDRPTWLVTPVDELRVEPGRHVVRWVSVVGGREVVREVRVDAGRTTTVEADFR